MNSVQLESEIEQRAVDDLDHFICCRVPLREDGTTVALCGLTVPGVYEGDAIVVSCHVCTDLAWNGVCPNQAGGRCIGDDDV